jgi:hypothetical protein
MIIINFLLFVLSGVGITNLIVNATILDNLRNYLSSKSAFLSKLLSCMMCSGFWVGFGLSIVFGLHPIVAGPIISLLSNVFSYFLEYIELTIALKAKQLEVQPSIEKDEDVD